MLQIGESADIEIRLEGEFHAIAHRPASVWVLDFIEEEANSVGRFHHIPNGIELVFDGPVWDFGHLLRREIVVYADDVHIVVIFCKINRNDLFHTLYFSLKQSGPVFPAFDCQLSPSCPPMPPYPVRYGGQESAHFLAEPPGGSACPRVFHGHSDALLAGL